MQPDSGSLCPTGCNNKFRTNESGGFYDIAGAHAFWQRSFSNTGMWAFLSIGAVSLFVIFIPTVTWIDKRSKEREAFYKAETLRRITEAQARAQRRPLN